MEIISIISAAIALVVTGWKSLDVWFLHDKIRKIKFSIRNSESSIQGPGLNERILDFSRKEWVHSEKLLSEEDIDKILGIAVASSNKLAAEVLVRVNAGLINVVISKLIYATKRNNAVKEASDFNLTIAEMLFTTKAKQSLIAYTFVAVAVFVHIGLSSLTSQSTSNGLLLFLAIFFALIHINQKILEFRIEKGFYGKNEYEAREMVSFLLNHSSKTDFSDGDGLKKLFPKVNDSEQELEAFDGLVGVTK